ncbi:hypothetical protein PsorP6_015273 [Peronosclerospora sorghi]|uniref:Uncharacterized protein n=1 Tax=Peronosclerospora sorghi TaxID=230839 RepID=A0ACC0VRU7_9STRA|nr:hypothetical protein PsorP6_015273 [Peronosclerospora sorghi]
MNGNGAAVKRIARTAGVANGTVTLYTDRVISALVRLASEFVSWLQRREISRRIAQRSGFVGAVGIVDGTHINFSERPAIDREVFFSRKHRYGFNAQTGLPASLYDSTAFTFTPISKQPEQFFSENEFLLGDSGYTLTSRMLIPYRQPAASRPTNATFNLLHSRARVKVEHAIGILKSRWASLRELRVHIRREAALNAPVTVTTQRDDWDEDEDAEEPLQRTESQEDGDISAARWRSRVKDAVVSWAEEHPTLTTLINAIDRFPSIGSVGKILSISVLPQSAGNAKIFAPYISVLPVCSKYGDGDIYFRDRT